MYMYIYIYRERDIHIIIIYSCIYIYIYMAFSRLSIGMSGILSRKTASVVIRDIDFRT